MATCQRTITASFVKKAGHISDVLDFRFRILLMLLCPYNYKQTSGRSSYHVAQRLTLDVVTLEGRTMSSSAYCLHHDHHSRGYPPSPASLQPSPPSPSPSPSHIIFSFGKRITFRAIRMRVLLGSLVRRAMPCFGDPQERHPKPPTPKTRKPLL